MLLQLAGEVMGTPATAHAQVQMPGREGGIMHPFCRHREDKPQCDYNMEGRGLTVNSTDGWAKGTPIPSEEKGLEQAPFLGFSAPAL